MASSPALQSRHGHSSPSVSGRKRHGHFAETSPKMLVGLQKVNLQLQKDIDKLERQAQTSVTNIANHQQAMKMSWRRLEHRRKMDSPLLSRAQNFAESSNPPKQHRTVLFSNTKLYVGGTPEVYHSLGELSTTTGKGEVEGANTQHDPGHTATGEASDHESRSTPQLLTDPADPAHGHTESHSSSYLSSSPYITSPYNVRRATPKRRTLSPLTLPQTRRIATSTPRVGEIPRIEVEGEEDMGKRPRTKSASEIKLPPIQSPTQPSLVTHTAVMDKSTLLQASQLMGLDSSQGPSRFREFYAGDRPHSRAIRLASPPPAALARSNQETRTDKNTPSDTGRELGLGMVGSSSSELTLAEMFEQIRHCRYIRHYHPDGTEVEELP